MENNEVITVSVQPATLQIVAVVNTPAAIPASLVPALTPAAEQSDFNFLAQYLLARG